MKPACDFIPLTIEDQRSAVVARFCIHHIHTCKTRIQAETMLDFATMQGCRRLDMRAVLLAFAKRCQQLT